MVSHKVQAGSGRTNCLSMVGII